jgi:hypothetical protein
MSTPFDLLEVVIEGETLQARPIEWINDEDGNPAWPTTYETTCPSCGQLTQFVVRDQGQECECGVQIIAEFDLEDVEPIEPQEPPQVIREKELNIDGLGKEEEVVVTNSTPKFRNPLDFGYPLDNVVGG